MFQYLVSSAHYAASYPPEINSQSLIYIKSYETKASSTLRSHCTKQPSKLKLSHRAYIFNPTFHDKITK